MAMLMASSVYADADEASLHADSHVSMAWFGDPLAPGAVMRTPTVGLGIRGTRAWHDWLALEVAVGVTRGVNVLRYRPSSMLVQDALPGTTLRLERAVGMLCADAGLTLRRGVVWILYGHVGAGAQVRWSEGRMEENGVPRRIEPDWTLEAVANMRAGVDYRFGKHLVAGVGLRGRQAIRMDQSYRSVGITVHVSGYWYP
ncbi:hypothetical protein [Haliangium sp.]|uniref:hypothetical protein n=1 Tax=Haliangium sp. TaxID=2663208 RepID=UPI003D14D32B